MADKPLDSKFRSLMATERWGELPPEAEHICKAMFMAGAMTVVQIPMDAQHMGPQAAAKALEDVSHEIVEYYEREGKNIYGG